MRREWAHRLQTFTGIRLTLASFLQLLNDAAKAWFQQVTKVKYRPHVYSGTCGVSSRRRQSTGTTAIGSATSTLTVKPAANGTAVVTAAPALRKQPANSTARIRTGNEVNLGNLTFQYRSQQYIPSAPFLGEVYLPWDLALLLVGAHGRLRVVMRVIVTGQARRKALYEYS